jgi:hypothetical protein
MQTPKIMSKLPKLAMTPDRIFNMLLLILTPPPDDKFQRFAGPGTEQDSTALQRYPLSWGFSDSR